ncbi:MAG: ABC transporter ATP-binding protein, partial [Clostridiaceae bacterium]|nr:ABC transporter ATP-binding protein [Clostridiaceae bacterium]
SGAVIAVSHDRYFLDKTVDKIFVFEGKGRIKKYTGNYTDIKESGTLEGMNDTLGQKVKEKGSENKTNVVREKERPAKFSYKEQKEYEEIDDIIVLLEERLQGLDEQIADAASDYVLLQQLMKEKEEAEHQMEEKMERWVYLNELAERIAKK